MKELKDYLHLYLPIRFMWVEDAVPFKKGEIGILAAKDLEYWDEYKKPILRPLSDMTEGEHSDFENISFSEDTKNWEYDEELKMSIGESTEFNRFAYLLSKHFDLFGLIEAGLAIDKTTLK